MQHLGLGRFGDRRTPTGVGIQRGESYSQDKNGPVSITPPWRCIYQFGGVCRVFVGFLSSCWRSCCLQVAFPKWGPPTSKNTQHIVRGFWGTRFSCAEPHFEPITSISGFLFTLLVFQRNKNTEVTARTQRILEGSNVFGKKRNSCGNLPFPKRSAWEPLKILRFSTKSHDYPWKYDA